MSDIKICTYNVRGLRQVKKRRSQFTYFHRHSFDIIFAQETHSSINDVRCWTNEWGGKIIFSHGTTLSKGVAISIWLWISLGVIFVPILRPGMSAFLLFTFTT
ncbi:hypothetical protein HOLleu_10343 [Holothuria leucospilota]|uniref:Uncharacterized protein n=1 Tax=Holothuria leucospilota TaxID=206669 RepID=A0A9Q1CE75_HOLLE|nr:hypothetical protein HOLleu_10343 [Holothuria leucospilota]